MRLAINIENDADVSRVETSYFPTSQSVVFIDNLATMALDGGSAHALLGAYGVGKSSLAAFTISLLSRSNQCSSMNPASHLLDIRQGPIAKLRASGGLLAFPVVGAVAPLASRLLTAIRVFAENEDCQLSREIGKLCNLIDPHEPTNEDVLCLLTTIASSVKQGGLFAGLLLVIDEFGRHLDYILSGRSNNDLHLLQDIAEATGYTASPLSLLIVQHYGLEHYTTHFSSRNRDEWEKVRGRFRETILNNTETDNAHIIGTALHSLNFTERSTLPSLKLDDQNPKILSNREFLCACDMCQPLHPMTVVLLSRLSRLLGQDDRTIVGWLTSELSSGFRMVQSKYDGGWLYPEVLYEHFFGDSLAMPSNPTVARRFTTIRMADERLGDDLSNEAQILFKTLALLSFCTGRGIYANESCALASLTPEFPFIQCIKELTAKSLVIYRRYQNSYTIWEGSDYDLTSRIDERISSTPLNIPATITSRFKRPLLANSHFIRTGNRRAAQLLWLGEGDDVPLGEGIPRVLIWLSDHLPEKLPSEDVIGIASIHGLTPHLREISAIQELLNEDISLQDDAVAINEMSIRLAFHESRIEALSQELLDSDLQWRVGNQRFTNLQPALSAVMDKTYPCSFNLHNDLVNRDKVSGSVMFALRKLIERLYGCIQFENIGIEKFPAERIIYESLLKQSGLHTLANDNKWKLSLSSDSLAYGLTASITKIRNQLIADQDSTTPSVATVINGLIAPPFGVKRTPAILLVILVLIESKDDIELYEDGNFLPHWGPDTLVRLLKAAERFNIKLIDPNMVSGAFMARYWKAVTTANTKVSKPTPITIARETLSRYSRLSKHARVTQSVSTRAREFRRSLEVAKSPTDMLFRTIPRALGYSTEFAKGGSAKKFFATLNGVLQELEGVDSSLLARFEQVFLDSFDVTNIESARTICHTMGNRILCHGDMRHGYDEFLNNLVDTSYSDHTAWLRSLIDKGLGISVPIRNWTDAHASQGEFILRRNLVAIQQVSDLLTTNHLHPDASPFVIYWPNPDSTISDTGELIARKMAALAQKIPFEERKSVIINLAKSNREFE